MGIHLALLTVCLKATLKGMRKELMMDAQLVYSMVRLKEYQMGYWKVGQKEELRAWGQDLSSVEQKASLKGYYLVFLLDMLNVLLHMYH